MGNRDRPTLQQCFSIHTKSFTPLTYLIPVCPIASLLAVRREDCEPFRGLQINTENAPKGVQPYNLRLNPLRKIVVWNKINPWNTERRRLSWFCCFLLELYFNLSLVASANNFRKIKELPLLSLESYVEQTLKWTGFMEIYTPVPSWASHYRNSFTSIWPQYRRFPCS